ncbi:MAG: exonuclease SbcCD subunit D [Eubacterium sp.]|nr:exonuclease SbcCD subunit D [Eubacterium sp.]
MKLIHISDLHLGKRVNEFPMKDDQEYILKEILEIIRDESPDGILIAGDVYDRSIPSEEAMKLWDGFLVSLAEKKIPVYAISGNHDSPTRLSDHADLVETAGIHLSPEYDGNAKKYEIDDEYGRVNIYLLPFIKPPMIKPFFPDEEIRDYTDACRLAIEKMNVDTSERNILVAHQFVAGAATCESEEINIGGLDAVSVDVFDSFDYVALGHLHGPQRIGRDTIRYSGTPLKYSFSEKNHKKSVTVIEIADKDTEIKISTRELKPLHDLREIRGTYEEVTAKSFYEGTATDDYLHVILTDEDDILDAIGKLRLIYPNIMKLSYDNKRTQTQQEITRLEEIEKKSPIDIAGELFKLQNNQPMSDEQKEILNECIETIWME